MGGICLKRNELLQINMCFLVKSEKRGDLYDNKGTIKSGNNNAKKRRI